MASDATASQRLDQDRIGNVLKWVLLATAIVCFGIFAWATDVTYRAAPAE